MLERYMRVFLISIAIVVSGIPLGAVAYIALALIGY
jgi:hypothetical protein